MDYSRLSDQELVSELVGKAAAERLCQRSPGELLLEAEKDRKNFGRILAAKEFVRRALLEDIYRSSALNSPREVRDFLRLHFVGKDREVFVVVLMDAQHRVIATEELFTGTLTQTSVYPREVVKCALRHNAAAVIFAHNHPSGIAEPSHADELLTRSLKSSLALVDVQVLDHFVIAGSKVMSFAERGLI